MPINQTIREKFWSKVRQAHTSILLNFSRKSEVEESGLTAKVYTVGNIVRIDLPRKNWVEGGKQLEL
jgi:hypothetical protein